VADVLVLGAGLVTRPMVRHLLSEGFTVKVASRTVSKAEKLIDGHHRGEAEQLLADDAAHLEQLIAGSALAVSMLPWTHHPQVAEACLRNGKHLVTTSYVKEPMQRLHEEARKSGLLNELGLDPGIDHMSAMEIFHGIRSRGGKVVSFRSYCGGLPAPEANTNPWGYKISWSPRSVALAGTNSARYMEKGKEVSVPGPELFTRVSKLTIEAEGLGTFEAYPNRDSVPYLALYGLDSARTMLRGTLRYEGWCAAWYGLVQLGMLGAEERPDLSGLSYSEFLRSVAGLPEAGEIRALLASRLGVLEDDAVLDRYEWLGLLADDPVPAGRLSPMDILVQRMSEKLEYAPGERDMIVLHHEVEAAYADRNELTCSTLVDYGIPHGDSSMSRTVSLPAAIGAEMILRGEIRERGVQIPVVPDIYEPIMARLREIGITFHESVQELGPGDDIEEVRCAR
jgi:saccharopine dehydrogenase (NADP+, L-glutamate forming)